MGRLPVVCVMLMAAVVAGCGPARSKDAGWHLSPEQCLAIGRAAAPEVERTFGPALNQPAVQAYVRTIGQRIARAADGTLPYRFTVLDNHVPILATLPSGEIYVSSGLLKGLRSEGELAMLLGHAMAHQSTGQAEQEVVRAVGRSALEAAAATATAKDAGSFVSRGAEADLERVVAAWISVHFTPEMEGEADRRGLDYAVATGYDPAEMIPPANLFESMQGPEAAAFTAAHPNVVGRAEDIRRLIARKYADRRGRVGQQEFRHEVLDRLPAD